MPATPNNDHEPDISFVIDIGKTIARHLQQGTLVVLESTAHPGAANGDLLAVLEVGSGLEAGRDFHLAFSVKRQDPGNPDSKVERPPEVIAGCTPICLEKPRHCIRR